ncbi:MAG: hypothetical protein WAQ52_10610 [Terriglobales bacterium]
MEASLGGPPESVVKALSKPNCRNVAKAVGQLLNWADSQTDQALIQRSLHLMRGAIRVVKKALPDTDPELIGGFFADLLDLWETGQKLDKELHNLTKLRFPQDRERLRGILIWISAIQIDMASYWIGEVKKDLPKLLQALDRLESKSRSGKQKRKLANARSAEKRKVARRATVAPNSAT